ncbi:TetR family transcriptional regulator C-terminal domain-containing protein [Streptomyces sp. RLB1-33]|uniref:TetR family transcriptional regulator C-terminal domain-containing protein n=1 Tax=Streptomyces mirabilis TaxID=68239 RepID=UPI002001DAD8|nr:MULTISPECIES: TetR family transcriptional regulator C-terminal domain-containing protein [Streptomyces]
MKRYADLVEVSAGTLREAVAGGELKPDTDCEALAEEFAAVMDGIQFQWALDPAGVGMAARMRAYLDRLLRSITVSGTGLPSDAHTDGLGRVCGHGDRGRRTRLSGCYESPPTWRRS